MPLEYHAQNYPSWPTLLTSDKVQLLWRPFLISSYVSQKSALPEAWITDPWKKRDFYSKTMLILFPQIKVEKKNFDETVPFIDHFVPKLLLKFLKVFFFIFRMKNLWKKSNKPIMAVVTTKAKCQKKSRRFVVWNSCYFIGSIWLMIWAETQEWASAEVFSSASDMKEVFRLERELVSIMDGFASKLQSKLNKINSYLEVWS